MLPEISLESWNRLHVAGHVALTRRTPLHFGSGVQPSDWLVLPFRFADGSCSGLEDQLFIPQRQLRCLRCRFDGYRVERTSFRAGVTPAEVQHLSRRSVAPTIGRQCGWLVPCHAASSFWAF